MTQSEVIKRFGPADDYLMWPRYVTTSRLSGRSRMFITSKTLLTVANTQRMHVAILSHTRTPNEIRKQQLECEVAPPRSS